MPISAESAFDTCEKTVRRHDPDRYLSTLFAPPEQRPYLFALYAFNYEIARVAESVREPMMAEIRLQWWREAVEGAKAGTPRSHNVAVALADTFAASAIPAAPFEALIDARSLDAAAETFADLPALEAYLDASSGGLVRLAARLLGASGEIDALARSAGIGLGLTGLLRALPFHAARRKLYLPLDLLVEERLAPQEIFAGRGGERLTAVIHRIAAQARHHLDAAAAFARPRGAMAAILAAAPSGAYLKLLTRSNFDPFRTPAELPLWRRQISMLAANFRGHV
jgi:phytoene synthase